MQRVRAFVPLGDIEDLQAAAAIPPWSAEELGAKLVQMEAKMDALMQKMRIVSSSMAALHQRRGVPGPGLRSETLLGESLARAGGVVSIRHGCLS